MAMAKRSPAAQYIVILLMALAVTATSATPAAERRNLWSLPLPLPKPKPKPRIPDPEFKFPPKIPKTIQDRAGDVADKATNISNAEVVSNERGLKLSMLSLVALVFYYA
jgi:hypothetical protein